MMRLSLMKTFFDTVDSQQHSVIADAIAQRWVEPGTTVRCGRASANFICEVRAGDQQYFLRFNHSSERDCNPTVAELQYLQHLSRQGVRLAKPIPSRLGHYVETVQTELGTFHAVLFEALPGEQLEIDELDDRHFELWGQALGRIHAASKGFTTPDRPSWSDHVALVRRLVPCREHRALEELAFVEEQIRKLPVGPDGFGLIHFDFELDNLKWEQNQVAALDFDDCALYWFMADVAFALRDLFHDSVSGVDAEDLRFQAFLKGYSAVKAAPADTARQIRIFLRMHNLVTFAKILRTVEEATESEPVWTANLRNRLAGKLDQYRQAFESCPLETCIGGL